MLKPVLEHMHLYCAELEPMIAFWTTAMGASLVCRRKYGDANGAILDIGTPAQLCLKEMPCKKEASMPACIEHLGFLVDDLETACRHVLAYPGATKESEPFRSGDFLCVFIIGPENMRVELVQKVA